MIYFVQDLLSGHVKIGTAEDPWRRLSKIQSDSPGSLVLIGVEEGGVERERQLHQKFAAHRSRGEWFDGASEIVLYAKQLPNMERAPRRARSTWGASGLTDTALAALVGVSRSQLCRIRHGKSAPSFQTAIKIARVTGLSFDAMTSQARAA